MEKKQATPVMAVSPGILNFPIQKLKSIVEEDLDKISLITQPEKRRQEVAYLSEWFRDKPVLALVWWCITIPKNQFKDSHHLDSWIRLLVYAIDRHVANTYKRQPRKIGWREEVLRGMHRRAAKLKKEFSETEDLWLNFVEGLLREGKRNLTCNSLTKNLFNLFKDVKAKKLHSEQFKRLGSFLNESNSTQPIWKGGKDFVLSLVSNLNVGILDNMLNGGKHEQKIATEAIRSELRAQKAEYLRETNLHTPARDALRRLILDLELYELAHKADQELGPLVPTGMTFLSILNERRKDQIKTTRRPNAHRRNKRRVEEGQ